MSKSDSVFENLWSGEAIEIYGNLTVSCVTGVTEKVIHDY
jgi:hypothetical protein